MLMPFLTMASVAFPAKYPAAFPPTGVTAFRPVATAVSTTAPATAGACFLAPSTTFSFTMPAFWEKVGSGGGGYGRVTQTQGQTKKKQQAQ